MSMQKYTPDSKDPMKFLVEEQRLRRADVIMLRPKRGFIPWLIRVFTKSYWSHVALVYLIPHPKEAYENTFIIESGEHGVDIRKIDAWLKNSKKFDVGIKRLETPWFAGYGVNDDFEEAKRVRDIRRRVRGYTLDMIDDHYDKTTFVFEGLQVILTNLFGIPRYLIDLLYAEEEVKRLKKIGKLTPSKYICSGLAQVAFYRAVRDSGVEPPDLWDVIAYADFDSANPIATPPDDELLVELLRTTTPEDFHRGGKYVWKYLVKDGDVYCIDGNEAKLEALLNS